MKAFFTGRSERSGDAGPHVSQGPVRRKKSSASRVGAAASDAGAPSTSSRRHPSRSRSAADGDGEDERRSPGGVNGSARGGGGGGLGRPLTESAVRALDEREEDEWEDEDGRSERRSERRRKSGDGEKREQRRSEKGERGRGEKEREKRDRDRDGRRESRSYPDGGEKSSRSGKARARDLVDAPESSRAIPPIGSFDQFPGQYNDPMFGPPSQQPSSSRPEAYPAGALPPADPAHQFPQQIPAAFDRPPATLGPTRADSFGAAAEYYMDEGQSVQRQPGVRPSTPNMLRNPDTHLMSASAEAHPAPDTGHGSAADFYSGRVSPVPFDAPSKPSGTSSAKPSRPGRQSSGGSNTPSKIGAVAVGAAAAGLIGAASGSSQQQQQATSYPTSQSNGTSSRPPPVKPTRQSTDPSIIGGQAVEYYGPSTPSKQNGNPSGKPPSSRPDTNSSNLPLYAAGVAAAGAAAYEYSHHHDQPHQSASYNATSNSPYRPGHGPGPAYPPQPYSNGSYSMQRHPYHFHEHRGPITRLKDGLLNLISDPDDVRRMEEYTEYIGVCRYCFDPRTTPGDGPRQHHYHRRPSEDSFEELRRRKSVEKMRRKGSSERIDKQSRYQSDKRSGGVGVGTGLAAAGLAAGAGAAMFAHSGGKNFDDTYSVRSGHRASSAMRRRSRSSSREQRRKSTYGTVRPGSGEGRNGHAGAALGAAALGSMAAAPASAGRPSRSDSAPRRHSPNSAYHRNRRGSSSSRESGGGGGGGFLSSFFSPSRNERKSRRRSRDGQAQQKRKKSRGFFSMAAGSESSFSDEDLVFGEANLSRISLSLRRKNSGRMVRRRRSSEHMAATVAGIGATAAALAAAQRGRDHRIAKRGSRPELGARRVEHVIGRDGRPQSPEEDSEWEDELPSEASSVMDEGLAFGEAEGLRRRESRESVGDAWGWRWGGKGQVRRRRSCEAFEGAYDGAVGPERPMYQEAAHDSRDQVPQQPMQELDPRPFSETGSTLGSMPGSFRGDDVPIARPGPGPIQQPQPIAPVSPRVFNAASASPEDRPRPRRTASSPTRLSGGFDLKDAALIGAGALAAGSIIAGASGRKSREGGSNVRFGLTEEQQAKEDRQRRQERGDAEEERRRNDRTRALKKEAERSAKEADARQREEEVRRRREDENRRAAEERAAAAARQEDERRQREERERWEREQAEQRRQEDARRAREEEAERQRAERARRDRELKEGIERTQREVDEASRRRKQEAEERRQNERDSVYAEDTPRRRSKQDPASDSPAGRSSSGWGAVAAGAMAAATAGAVLAGFESSRSREQDPRREGEYDQYPDGQALYQPIADSQPLRPDQTPSGAPVMDDDLFDKDFFANRTRSRSPADHARQAEIARKAAEKVVRADQVIQDMDDYYNAPSVSQAEFFAPRDILEQRSGGTTRAAEAVAGDVQVFNARPEDEQMVRFDPQGRNQWAPYGVPKLQVISPTPPPASPLVMPVVGAGERGKEKERSKSPLSRAADAAAVAAAGAAVVGGVVEGVAGGAANEGGGKGRGERSRSITWGEDKTHVYDPPTPESVLERERSDGSYMDARDAGPPAQDAMVEDREEAGEGESRTAYKAEELEKDSSSGGGSYRAPFAESASDAALKESEPAEKVAESLNGLESSEPSGKRHIPGSFDDDEMESPLPTPPDREPVLEESPAYDPPLSKKDRKKKAKAAAAAAVAAFDEPSDSIERGLERVQTLPEDDQTPAETPKAVESPAATDDDYFTGGKKVKKKGKKGKAAASAWDEEPVRPGIARVTTLPDDDNSPAQSRVPEPSEQPTRTRAMEPDWAPPLSRKDEKKRAKAAAAAEAFGGDFGEPIRPSIDRVNTLPDDDTTPAESPVPERSEESTPLREAEPEWEPPLSKKDKKKREKAAAAAAAAFDDDLAEPSGPGIDRVATLPDDDQTPAESPVPDPSEESGPAREVEPEWEPPLSKKDKKKRDKAAKAAAAFDAFDEPATERPGLDRVQTLPDDAETPGEEAPAEGYSSKKDKKKKKKDKAADRGASFTEEPSEPSTPTPLAPGESWADAVESEPFSAEPESIEPAAEGNADDYFMSKKDKKKRDKAAKRGLSESSTAAEDESPSTEVTASEADLPKLSKKEQKKRDKESRKQGFADVAQSMMTGAGLAAMADAAAKDASPEPDAEQEEWSTGKKSKKTKEKGKDSDRDSPTEQSDSGNQTDATPRDPYDPFQYQIKDSTSPPNEEAAADFSTPKIKKDKKKKRESGRFNEPAASSPLREEWNYDDYMGQTAQRDESKTVEPNGEGGVAVEEKPEESSSRRQSPDDGRARSVAFDDAAEYGEGRRSTSGKARSEVGYADDRGYYDDNRSVAGSEPVGYYDKPSKRQSRHEDDDARSEAPFRSKRDKEEPSKKEKKGGIFGLFSRNKSNDNVDKSDEPSLNRTPTRDSNEDDVERRRKKKQRDSSAYDDGDARSTTSNRQSYPGDDTRKRRRSSRNEDGDYDTRSEPGRKHRGSSTYDDYGYDDDAASRADTEGGGRTRRSKRSGDDNDADRSFLGVRVEDLPPLPASDDEFLDIEAPVERSEQGHGTPVSAEIDEACMPAAREGERSLAWEGMPETPTLPDIGELPAFPESGTASPELPPQDADPSMKGLPAVEGLPALPASRAASPKLPPQDTEPTTRDLSGHEELPTLPDSGAESSSRSIASSALGDVALADAERVRDEVEDPLRTPERNDVAIEAATMVPLPLSRSQSSLEPAYGEAPRALQATRDLPPVPAAQDLEHPDPHDLPPLPGSPLEAAFETPDRPGLASRPVSTTAVPIKFPFGHARQGPERAASTSSTVLPSQSSPTSSHKRTPRPTSTEFRPLYLVERNTKPQEVEEALPSLPSSKPSSRASSVHGSDDWHSAAEDPPSPERERLLTPPQRPWDLSIDIDQANANQDPEYLDSAQTTPKATEFPHHFVDRPLRQQPQFYTWEDFEQDERLHSHESAQPESLQTNQTHAAERAVNLAEVPQDLPPLPASGPPTPTEPNETPELAEPRAQVPESTPSEDVTEPEATHPKFEGLAPAERTPSPREEQAKKPEGRVSWSAKGFAAAAFGFGGAFGRKISPFQQEKEAAKVNTDAGRSNEGPPASDPASQLLTPFSEQVRDLPQEQDTVSADTEPSLLRSAPENGEKGKGGNVKTISSIPPTPLGFAGEGDISDSPAPSAEPSASLGGPAPRAQDSYFPDLTHAIVEGEPPALREVESTAPASSATAIGSEAVEREDMSAINAEISELAQADGHSSVLSRRLDEVDVCQPSVPEDDSPFAPTLARKQSKKAKKKQQKATAWLNDDVPPGETATPAEEPPTSAEGVSELNADPEESREVPTVNVAPDSNVINTEEAMPQDVAADQAADDGGEDDFAGFSMSRKKSKKDRKKKARALETTDPNFDSPSDPASDRARQDTAANEETVDVPETAGRGMTGLPTSRDDDGLVGFAVSRKKSKKDKKKTRQSESAWLEDEQVQPGPTDSLNEPGETASFDRPASQPEPMNVPLPDTEDRDLYDSTAAQILVDSSAEPVHSVIEDGILDRTRHFEPRPADVPLPVADDRDLDESLTAKSRRSDEVDDAHDFAREGELKLEDHDSPYIPDASRIPLPQDADDDLDNLPTAPAAQFEPGKLLPGDSVEAASSLWTPSRSLGDAGGASSGVEPAEVPLPASEDADLEAGEDLFYEADKATSASRDAEATLEAQNSAARDASAEPGEELRMTTSKKGKKGKKGRKTLQALEEFEAATPQEDTPSENVITQDELDAEVAARDVAPPPEADGRPKKKGKKQSKFAEDAALSETGDREAASAADEPLPAESQPNEPLQSLDTPQAPEADDFWPAAKKKGKKGRDGAEAELAKEDEPNTSPAVTRDVPAEEPTQGQAALFAEPAEPVAEAETEDTWASTKKSKKDKKAASRAAQLALDDFATPENESAPDDGSMALATASNQDITTPIEPAETPQETEAEEFWAPTKKGKKGKKASRLAAQNMSNNFAEPDTEQTVGLTEPSAASTGEIFTPMEAAETLRDTEPEEIWAAPKKKGKKGKKAQSRLAEFDTATDPDIAPEITEPANYEPERSMPKAVPALPSEEVKDPESHSSPPVEDADPAPETAEAEEIWQPTQKKGKKGKKTKASRQSSWIDEPAPPSETPAAREIPAITEGAEPVHHADAVDEPLDLAADSMIPPLDVKDGTREHADPTVKSLAEAAHEADRHDREAASEVAPEANEPEALQINHMDANDMPEALQETAIGDDDAAFTVKNGKRKGKKSKPAAEDWLEDRTETAEGSEADHVGRLSDTALGAAAGAAAFSAAYAVAGEEPSGSRGRRDIEPDTEGAAQDTTLPAAAEYSAQEAAAEEYPAFETKRSKKDKKKAMKSAAFDPWLDPPAAGEPMEADVPLSAPATGLQDPPDGERARDVSRENPAPFDKPTAADDEYVPAPANGSKKDRRKAKQAGTEWSEPVEEAASLDPPELLEDSTAEPPGFSAAKLVDEPQDTTELHAQPTRSLAEPPASESADRLAYDARPTEAPDAPETAVPEDPGHDLPTTTPEEGLQPASAGGAAEGSMSQESEWPDFTTKKSKKDKKKAKRSGISSPAFEESGMVTPPVEPIDVAETSKIDEDVNDSADVPHAKGPEPTKITHEDALEAVKGGSDAQNPDWLDYSSQNSKKDKKKAKSGGYASLPLEQAGVPEALDELQSTDQSRNINDEEDELLAAAPAETVAAEEVDSQDRAATDETYPPSQEAAGPEFTTKKSKKDKKKAKKGGLATPVLEEPDTTQAEPQPNGGFDEFRDRETPMEPAVGAMQPLDADPPAHHEQGYHAHRQPEPDHMPSDAAHSGQDVDFAATLAAGLAESGFDPNLVVQDPFYQQRASPPASAAEAVPDEADFTSGKRKKSNEGKQSQFEEPDLDVGSKNTSAKDASATDTDFDADVTQSLQASGFDPALLQRAMEGSQSEAKDIPEDDDLGFTMSKKRKGKKGKAKAAAGGTWDEPVTPLDETAPATPDLDKTLEDTSQDPLAAQASEVPPEVDRTQLDRLDGSDRKETSTPAESDQQAPADPLDPAHTFNVAGDKDMDVDEMDQAYSAFKRKERRKSKKKRNVAFDEPTPGPSEPVSEAERNIPEPFQADLAVQQASEREPEHTRDVAVEEAPAEPESPSKVRSIFPGLERVKRRKSSASAAGEPQVSPPHYEKTGPPGLLHTSEISQTLPRPVGAERAMPQDSARDRHAGPSPQPPVGWSFDALDNAAPIEDPPSVSAKPHEVIRDSGYQEVSTPTSNRHSGERSFSPIPEVRSRPSRDSLHSRRSAEPLHVDTGHTIDWRLSVGKTRSAAESPKGNEGMLRSTSNGSVAETPLESTTKDRASYLFQATPLNSKESATPTNSDQRRRRDDYFAEREAQSEESPMPTHHSSAERGTFSPPPTGPLSPRTPLDAIPEEHGHAQGSKRKSDGSEAASVKSPRRSDHPHSLRSARERTLSPTSRSLGLIVGQRSLSNPLSTDELINSLDWPPMDEARDTINIDRSLRRSTLTESVRSPSAMSNLSNVSANHQLRSSMEARSFSRASNRSSTPTLRRIDRSLSGDLRAASRRGETGSAVGARSSPKTIPFEPPPTPPPNDEDVIVAGAAAAAGAAAMADVFSGYGDAQGSQVSPTRPPSVRKRQSMHIVDLESRLDALTAENRALQEARMAAEQSREAFATAPGVNAQEALQHAELQIREKDAEIHRINPLIGPLQEELEHLREINAGLTEANRNLVDDTNGRYATLQAEHANAHEQWQSASRELEQMRSQHGQGPDGMRATVEQQVANALADKNAEILRLREELDIASERIRALQVQIQASTAKDFLVTRDEDYFDGACQKLCQHVQQWVLRFSKLSDNRICRLSTELRNDKMEAALDNAILDGSDVDQLLGDRVRRRDVFMSVVMTMIWEYVFTRYLFGMDREQRQKLKALEKVLAEVGPPRAIAQWRATTLTLLSKRPDFAKQCAMDTEAVAREVFDLLRAILPPPSNAESQLMASLIKVVSIAADLAIEMRTQRAEYIMLPPLQPEYDSNGDLVRKVHFNALLMNERSGMFSSNEELEQERAVVKIVLFPLVVKKGDEFGEGEEEIVVCPAQVLVQNEGQGRREGKKVVRVLSGAMEIEDPRRASRQSVISTAPGSVAF